uniref:Calcineurin-like phosphoesterase n=1 Tax=Candidatus Kentrum sp. LFY TaxID=2126342 RepID=A0A450X5U5_9GAMM|nr:MAG: Calcineurin-like phosphoesterase [Candidatus Kentron sp. LFY]
MTTFSWLHLTDLHYGTPKDDWMWPETKSRFYCDIDDLREECGPWDLILFTGDLTGNVDSEKEPDIWKKMEGELEEIRLKVAALSHGEKPLLLAVPGNHDLERPGGDNPAVEELGRILRKYDVKGGL